MALPIGTDYSDAIQNPRFAFSDPELQAGVPEINSIGTPKARSGAFASVFKMQCGNRNWAVRCFTREVPDQKFRYQQISQHLANARLPYTVGFSYLPQGIKVGRSWHPIVKMEWIHGESLKTYVQRNLQNPNELILLADRWVAMSRALREASVAHGDLQHGNVLVVGGELKLVDYDGMFVPGLAGRLASEIGQRNYQHPKRSERDFGLFLDNFSSWVVYGSLLLLAANPSIWQIAQAKSDETLVFIRDDFEDPERSPTFRAMEFSTNPAVQRVQQMIREFIAGGIAAIPPLHERINATLNVAPADGSWLESHVNRPPDTTKRTPASPPLSTSPPAVQTVPTDATWLQSHQPPLPRKYFRSSFAIDRVFVFLTTVFFFFVAFFGPSVFDPNAFIGAVAVWAVLNSVFMFVRYRHDTAVKAFRELKQRNKPLLEAVGQHQDFIAKADKKKDEITRYVEGEIKKLEQQRAGIDRVEQMELDSWQKGLQQELNRLAGQRQDLFGEETRRIQRLQATSRVNTILGHINSLATAEANEISEVTRALQNDHVSNYLRRQKIADATIGGIGPKLKERLYSYGIYSAMEINQFAVSGIPGFGPSKAQSLYDWRAMQHTMAQQSMPKGPDPNQISDIRSKYLQQRQALERDRKIENERLQAAEQVVRNECNASRRKLDQEEHEARAQVNGTTDTTKRSFGAQRAQISKARQLLDDDFRGKLKKVNDLAQTSIQELQKMSHQRGIAERDMLAYERLRFAAYIKGVLIFWRRAA